MTRARINADQAHTESLSVVPHIIPGVLYPAVAGKLLDGSTSHSGAYGTAQADGYSYYYTDIKGSKPIKDPRIGAYFGSQRYMFSSLQILEQETATHGSDVYSVDGREWIRRAGSNWSTVDGNNGHWYYVDNGAAEDSNFWEITGYFNAANWLSLAPDSTNDVNISIDGTKNSSAFAGATGSNASPIANGRYINAYSVIALSFDSTPSLGIHTLKLSNENGDYMRGYGVDLIAQDTSSTANRSKIQIPSQNVVSYGKKFTVSGTPHYDPFNGFTNDTTLFSSVVDVATSLGLGTATTWGAPWDKGSNDHIRPFNGGRVVKWVDSSGTIKTSVTMMPRNAQNIGNNNASGSAGVASNEITTASATNTHTINFSDDVIDDSLAEVAKTYNWREFGNGSANQGAGGSLADASMLSGHDDIAYVMDDGLSSLSAAGVNVDTNQPYVTIDVSEFIFFTFIGTGFSISSTDWTGAEATELPITVVQNLPYGTHIVKVNRASDSTMTVIVDGVTVSTDTSSTRRYYRIREVTIYQPKKPPIPEDSVVIADYMLMADFVGNANADISYISKGVRFCSASRDGFYNSGAALTLNLSYVDRHKGGMAIYTNLNGYSLSEGKFTAFGNAFGCYFDRDTDRYNSCKVQLDGSLFSYDASNIYGTTTINSSSIVDKSGSASANFYGIKNQVLGLHTFGDLTDADPGSAKYNTFAGFEVASPIHTSSHYQTFETPFLKELVGGDRNMEQTNLVVTPDGKSWDEVTRDTSYLGNIKVSACTSYNVGSYGGIGATAEFLKWDEWRGVVPSAGLKMSYNKDFAIGYDRVICLVDGMYTIMVKGQTWDDGSAEAGYIRIYTNGSNTSEGKVNSRSGTSDANTVTNIITVPLKRGDYVQAYGKYFNTDSTLKVNFEITKV